MFKIFLSPALLLVVLILLLFSCRKHEMRSTGTLSLDKIAIRLDTTVGTQAIVTVRSTVSWKAELVPAVSWIRIDIASAGAANTVVRLVVLSNNGTTDPQVATITFSPVSSSDISPVTLTVTQRPYTFNLGFRKALGGNKFEGIASQAVSSQDGGTVIAGTTFSNDGDVLRNFELANAL
jgi:hypothetical protein